MMDLKGRVALFAHTEEGTHLLMQLTVTAVTSVVQNGPASRAQLVTQVGDLLQTLFAAYSDAQATELATDLVTGCIKFLVKTEVVTEADGLVRVNRAGLRKAVAEALEHGKLDTVNLAEIKPANERPC